VDDDAASRELLVEAVSKLGHRSLTAEDGAHALKVQSRRTVDVILSDWSMPQMSGIELCRRVRARESSRYICFMFMTAFGDRAHLLEGLRAGADAYLTKPVDREQLEARLLSAARVISQNQVLARRVATLRKESQTSFAAARIDPLTQIGNRLRLREDLSVLQERLARYGHRYCGSLSDVDMFKSYNDTFGHVVGDEALRRVAAAMSGALRQGDSLYRYGGEEFLTILPEQSLDEAGRAMHRVCKAVADLEIPHPASPTGNVTISVGVAEVQDPASAEGDWLSRADTALYRAKREGRNRVALERLLI
jgi:diguanylate cyclase (GGDEF)-like protein